MRLTSWLEQSFLRLLDAGAFFVFLLLLALYFSAILAVAAIPIGLVMAYPHIHNCGLSITQRIEEAADVPEDLPTGRYVLFSMGLWTVTLLFVFGLVATFLKAMALIPTPVGPLATAVAALAAVGGVPFGLAIALYGDEMPGRGEIVSRAIDIVRDNFSQKW